MPELLKSVNVTKKGKIMYKATHTLVLTAILALFGCEPSHASFMRADPVPPADSDARISFPKVSLTIPAKINLMRMAIQSAGICAVDKIEYLDCGYPIDSSRHFRMPISTICDLAFSWK